MAKITKSKRVNITLSPVTFHRLKILANRLYNGTVKATTFAGMIISDHCLKEVKKYYSDKDGIIAEQNELFNRK